MSAGGMPDCVLQLDEDGRMLVQRAERQRSTRGQIVVLEPADSVHANVEEREEGAYART